MKSWCSPSAKLSAFQSSVGPLSKLLVPFNDTSVILVSSRKYKAPPFPPKRPKNLTLVPEVEKGESEANEGERKKSKTGRLVVKLYMYL
jgi:hypothetical protein